MNKKEAIAELRTQQTWSSKKVVAIVNSMTHVKACEGMTPSALQVADMFYDPRINHPCMIVEQRGDMYMVVGLTTAETGLTATKIESRYQVVQYAYPMLQLTTLDKMSANYIGSVTAEEAKRVKLAVFDFIRNSQS